MKALDLSADILSKEIVVDKTLSRLIGLSAFIILTALGAAVRIPLGFTPVPITLQTFFVLLSGAVLGRNWGALSQIGYIFLGVLGLPIFSGAQSGTVYLFGPTGGYLAGFVLSSWITGALLEKSQNSALKSALVMSVACLGGIYLFGVLGLAIFLKSSITSALALGFLPFIPGDIIKIAVAGLLLPKIKSRCREIF
ncbi:MAG: biotin transporter BioY [Candidatus Omnitrophica bacterium]|nr:biotin transporter BioY [Candidatus Omnitrophota bacterium]